MSTRGPDRYSRCDRVIARTHRGLEEGEVLCEANDEISKRMPEAGSGQIVRKMTGEDYNDALHIKSKLSDDFATCEKHVHSLNMPMELVDLERIFGGERLVVYYLAEDRVDFRDLVKNLSAEFQTRIEMRQIGIRDEAKLLADYGDCGKPVCCNTHLIQMPPVSMRMAKLQKATLDPTKISGRCGRLKCCLRYEFDTYEELHKDLPPPGSELITSQGKARVINMEILTQQLLIVTEDNRRMMIPLAEVISVVSLGRRDF